MSDETTPGEIAPGVIYPLRASGEYAGTKCPAVQTCKKYARFVAIPLGEPKGAQASCAIHLAATVRTIQLLTGKPVIVQEIPGNWPRELILVDAQLALLGSGTV